MLEPCLNQWLSHYDYNMIFNYSHTDNAVGLTGVSKIRVTEIEGGIIQWAWLIGKLRLSESY